MLKKINLELPIGFNKKEIDESTLQIICPEPEIKYFISSINGSDLKSSIDDFLNKVVPGFVFEKKNEYLRADKSWDHNLSIIYELDDKSRFASLSAKQYKSEISIAFVEGPISLINKRISNIMTIWDSIKGNVFDLSNSTLQSIVPHKEELFEFINGLLNEFKIPGLQLAIIEDSKVVISESFGVLDIDSKEKVNPKTQFMIGSTTKPITTLLMAKLIDEGFFNWDTKVVDIYSKFELKDLSLSKTLTMEDIVSAGTGIPRDDLPMLFNSSNNSPEERVFNSLKNIEPSLKAGESFQYNNQIIAAAGYISAYSVLSSDEMRKTYYNLMQEKIFNPLNMSRTFFYHSSVYNNFARPCTFDYVLGKEVSEPGENTVEFFAPAGSLWSTAEDLAKFFILELDSGEGLLSPKIVSSKNLLHRRQPKSQVKGDMFYGLCWLLLKKDNLDIISHGGGIQGFASDNMIIPEKKCGVIVLANDSTSNLLINLIQLKIFETWFGTYEKINETIENYRNIRQKTINDFKENLISDKDFLSTFLGKHQDSKLGIFEIKKTNDSYCLLTPNNVEYLLSAIKTKNETYNICVISPGIFIGLRLIPNDKKSFNFNVGQHFYSFEKI